VPGSSYAAVVHASEMAEGFPLIGVEDDAWTAVLPTSQVLRILVPHYVQDDSSLAGVLTESMADRVCDNRRGKKVRH
jgi:hypothetical protein